LWHSAHGSDEIGRTQQGNNNAYCQDNEISWYDWENVDDDLLAFAKTAIALRRRSPALRPLDYLRGPGGEPAQMVLYRPDAQQMTEEDWQDPAVHALAVALDGREITDADGATTTDRFLLLLNADGEQVEFTIPVTSVPWRVVLTTGEPDDTPSVTENTVTLDARSILLFHGSSEHSTSPTELH
jgi:isoamylase